MIACQNGQCASKPVTNVIAHRTTGLSSRSAFSVPEPPPAEIAWSAAASRSREDGAEARSGRMGWAKCW
jgi:hypothetical protein